MIGASDLLWGGVLPGAVAACMFVFVWQLTGKSASAWRVALVIGYIAGHWGLDVRNLGTVAAIIKSIRTTEARDWLPLLACLAVLPDALACVGKLGPWLGWLLRIALCLFVPWRLVRGTAYLPLMVLPDFGFESEAWSTGESFAWIGGIAAVLLFTWQWIRIDDRPSGFLVRSALAVVVALGGAIIVAMSDSLIYGQLFGVLTAALAGCGLASAFCATERGPDAAVGPLVIVFGSLVLLAYFFAKLTFGNAALLMFAMTVAIGWLPLPKRLSPRWNVASRTAICLGALIIAVAIAGFDFAATQAQTEGNPYENFQP